MTSLESEFTFPRPECEHPEYWHAWDGQSAEVEVTDLLVGFVRALQPEVVVETGSHVGRTSFEIGTALELNTHGHLHTVEIDPELAAQAVARCKDLPVSVHCGDSLEWVPPDGIGFAWFDSLTYLREPEFRRYLPKMLPGAIVGFHDCGPQHPTRPWVEQLAQERLLRLIYLPTPRGVIFGEVL